MPNEANPLDESIFQGKFSYEPQPVAGRGIIVTGGTTGIGRAVALLLVARGARVLIFGRHEKELGDALADIKAVGGGEIYGLVADTSRPDDMKRVFEAADRDLGTLHALVNNAALPGNSILDSGYDEWREIVDTNLLGYLVCSREAAGRFLKSKAGHIVNIGSMSAKVCESGADVYVATKSGIRGFTDSLAKQLNEKGIRVTLIEPGLVGSEMTVDKVPKSKQPESQENQEMLRTEDVAHAVLYALEQPARCNIAVVQIRPTKQII